MMRFESEQDKEDLARVINKLDIKDLWTLIKWAKHIRGRCRQNIALINYLNRVIPQYRFSEVPKTTPDGRPYKGMMITHTVSKESIGGDEDES